MHDPIKVSKSASEIVFYLPSYKTSNCCLLLTMPFCLSHLSLLHRAGLLANIYIMDMQVNNELMGYSLVKND
jgi:hypothetical protein